MKYQFKQMRRIKYDDYRLYKHLNDMFGIKLNCLRSESNLSDFVWTL